MFGNFLDDFFRTLPINRKTAHYGEHTHNIIIEKNVGK